MSNAYVKSRTTINTGGWTAIIAPVNCNNWAMKNGDGSAFLICTDPNDANTEDTVAANAQEGVVAPYTPEAYPGAAVQPRFLAGSTVCWAKALSGTGPIVVTWVA